MSALLLEIALKSSLVIATAAVIDLSLRRRGSAASRHLLWTIAIGGVLVLPAFLVSMPRWELRVPIASAAQPISRAAAVVTARPLATSALAATAANDIDHHHRVPRAGHDEISLALIATWTYAAGVALLLLRLGLQQRAARRLVRASTELNGSDWEGLLHECVERLDIDTPVRLVRGCDVDVPMTFGTRLPTILVPAAADTWSDERRRAVLLHELAHIVRRDCATQTAAAFACAVYWLHPGVWWAASRMRREREIACDDRVVAAGTQPGDYAGHLLELAYSCTGSGAPALAVSMARPSEIEGRLRAILDAARNRRTLPRRARVWIAVTALAAIGIVAATRATFVPLQAQSAPRAGNLIAASPQQPPRGSSRADADPRDTAEGRSGTWQMWISDDGRTRVMLSDREGSWHSIDSDIDHVEFQFHDANGTMVGTAKVTREAGTFALEGILKPGPGKSAVAAGTFTFSPSATFAAELVKRGFARPTTREQYLLARSDVGFAFIDELAKQGYTRPDLATLVRASEHGVTMSHLRAMAQLGYRLSQVDALITQVDHGVSPDFVRGLRDAGFTNVSADDLVRTRDHGVDASYIKELKEEGFDVRSLDEAIRTRDHGVDVEYVRGLRQLGFRMTLAETIAARDHGVDLEYIRDLAGFGYSNLPMPELIRTRDHGVDAEYIRELRHFGYQTSLAALITARDHGVDPGYIRALAAQGYKGLSLEQLIRLRDHGVDPEFVERVKKTGLTTATPDDLITIRDRGPMSDRLVATFLDELNRLRNRFAR